MEKDTGTTLTIVVLLGAAAAAAYIVTRPTPEPLTPLGAVKKVGAYAEKFVKGGSSAIGGAVKGIGSTIKGWF